MTSIDRRRFLLATIGSLGLGGVGGAALAACGSSNTRSADTGVTGTGVTGSDPVTSIHLAKDGFGLVPRFDRALLVPGANRMPFSLSSAQQVLSDGPEQLTAIIVDASNKVVVPSLTAKRRRVTEGIVYWDFHATLATVGQYTVYIDGGDNDGAAIIINDPATVQVPYPGQQLPPFDTPTTADPRGVDPICTRLAGGPCPFHDITLTQALTKGTAVAYLIGTPAHCQFGTCAPALEALIISAKRLGDKLTVVHAEVYTDDTTTTPTPAVEAYHLEGEPDLWIADATGKIVTRLEGAWEQTELDETLDAIVT